MYEGEVEGLPVQSPWVDVRSIVAGGGSIAYVDAGGLLRVGPGSAGADPGPACYGRGGTNPTVTDAAYVLGMLGHGRLASGLQLHLELAARALEPLAEQLGFSVERTAQGVMTIAAANMAGAIRAITIERGQDPRRARLMPFGGAGPLFGTLLAAELDIAEIVVPPYAGNFSAWGLIGSDLTQTAARTRITRLSDEGMPILNDILDELFATLETRSAGREMTREIGFDMRFAGQEHTLTIAVPGERSIAATAAEIEDGFRSDYDRTFGHLMEEVPEVVSVRATARTALERRAAEHLAETSVAASGDSSVDAWSFTRGERLPFAIVDRMSIDEDGLAGPAIVLEPTATTYLDAGFTARRGPGGVLFLTDTKEA
jgi:N-methylhydantoinase A